MGDYTRPEPLAARLLATALVGGLVYVTVNEVKFGESTPPEEQPEADIKKPGVGYDQMDMSLSFTRFLGDAKNSMLFYNNPLEERDLEERSFDETHEVEATSVIDSQGTKLIFGAAVAAYIYYQFKG